MPPRPSLHVLRIIVLATAAASLVMLAVLAMIGLGFTPAATVWVALPAVLATADLVLVPSVGSTVRPLPHAVSDQTARAISVRMVHGVTYIRLALAESPALFGVVGSLIAGSLVPGAVGVGAAVLLLSALVYPRRGVLDGLRERLESGGVASHLPDELGWTGR